MVSKNISYTINLRSFWLKTRKYLNIFFYNVLNLWIYHETADKKMRSQVLLNV